MRALHRVSFVLASLLVAGAATAHRSSTSSRSARNSAPPRSRQASTAATAAHRTRAASASERPSEPAKDGVVFRTRRIVRGDSLSGIAASYGISVQALAAANGLRPEQIIRTGQDLVIPQVARPGGGNDWLKYVRSPEQAGRLDLSTYKLRFRGQVVDKGRLSPAARRSVSELLGVHGSRPPVPDRLIRLLVRVSDTFGGRPIRIVSGYRTSSYFADSRHKHSAAVDFSIAGVPNAIVRQYLLLFDDVGVGYYPNSSFVHLDVRDGAMQWIDYAGPGEAPRQRPFSPRFARGTPSVSDLDEIAESVVAAMNGHTRSRQDPSASGPSGGSNGADTSDEPASPHGDEPNKGTPPDALSGDSAVP
jgi:LysM repeat protein